LPAHHPPGEHENGDDLHHVGQREHQCDMIGQLDEGVGGEPRSEGGQQERDFIAKLRAEQERRCAGIGQPHRADMRFRARNEQAEPSERQKSRPADYRRQQARPVKIAHRDPCTADDTWP